MLHRPIRIGDLEVKQVAGAYSSAMLRITGLTRGAGDLSHADLTRTELEELRDTIEEALR